MKTTIYAIMAFITLAGCQRPSTEEEIPPTIISLDEENITIYCGESKTIGISGTEAYCSAEEDSDFVVWASGGNGEIEIEGKHVGETFVTITCDDAENEAICNVTVLPTIDYIGSVAPLCGKTKSEVKEVIDKSYEKDYTDSQRGCITYYYNKSGYLIANRYYYSEEKLCGIHKSIESPDDTETQAYINIATSLDEYMEAINGSSASGRIYSHPDGYYAVLYSPTMNQKHDIFYAASLEDAKSHPFATKY